MSAATRDSKVNCFVCALDEETQKSQQAVGFFFFLDNSGNLVKFYNAQINIYTEDLRLI